MNKLIEDIDYKNWLVDIKSKIKNSQIKAALTVNSELITLYWEIGAMICEKQKNSNWGSKLIEQVAKDLNKEFSDLTGFSRTNLYSMKNFYLFYNEHNIIIHQLGEQIEHTNVEQLVQQIPYNKQNTENVSKNEIVHQLGGQLKNTDNSLILTQIPWRHHTLILQKIKNIKEAIFYIKETIENNWSRSVLEYQIETNLYNRQGKAVSNFKQTLPKPESDLAQQILKDPYNFDFLTLTKRAKEKDLEQQKDNFVVDYSLKDINKPIGVSEFTYNELPEDIKNELPSEKPLQEELKKLEIH